MPEHRIYGTAFAKVYPMYVQKAPKKQRTKERGATVAPEQRADHGPRLRRSCGRGRRPTDAEIRYLDKLVDELAKGKPLEKIPRQGTL